MIIQVKKTYEVTNEDIVDILSALDYYRWFSTINYKECLYAAAKAKVGKDAAYEEVLGQILYDGGKLQFVDSEDPEARYDLTLAMLLKGIETAIEQEYYPEYNWYGDGKLDSCRIDTDVADVILQLGLFGEVVFG